MIDSLNVAVRTRRPELETNRAVLLKTVDDNVLPHFDIDYAAALMLGYNARTATPEQRARFGKAAYGWMMRGYAEGVLQLASGTLRLVPSKSEPNDRRTLVRTQIVEESGETTPVDYVFHRTGDGDWKFYDVVVDGISYVTTYRNQVTVEIQRSGLDGVIAKLEAQGKNTPPTADKNGPKALH